MKSVDVIHFLPINKKFSAAKIKLFLRATKTIRITQQSIFKKMASNKNITLALKSLISESKKDTHVKRLETKTHVKKVDHIIVSCPRNKGRFIKITGYGELSRECLAELEATIKELKKLVTKGTVTACSTLKAANEQAKNRKQ